MKLIKPKFDVAEQQFTSGYLLNDLYRHIERCGRTCYKSQDKATESSAWPFVQRMIMSDHTAMLEHGTIYLTIAINSPSAYNSNEDYKNAEEHFLDIVHRYQTNKFSKVILNYDGDHAFITTNFRVIVENKWQDDLVFMTAPTIFHEKRMTVRFTCDIGVSREFNRHRANSMAEQSTRYCNYTKDKFGGECSFVFVPWADTSTAVSPSHTPIKDASIISYDTSNWNAVDWWIWSLETAELAYKKEIELGWKPQQARISLPLNTATELIHTAFISDWKHFIDLRSKGTTGAPHPQAKELADQLVNKFSEMHLL